MNYYIILSQKGAIIPRIDNKHFYTSAIDRYGITAKGLHWHSQKNQMLRFDAILKLLPDNLSGFSIGDAGCGFGDFYLYMEQKPKKYIGIDSLPNMQFIASKKTAQKIILANICKEELPKVDYYVCSGALNILTRFETYQFIQNCYRSSKIGFVFNALYGNKRSKIYNYLNKQDIYKIAKSLGVKNISFVENYLDGDITVVFLKILP